MNIRIKNIDNKDGIIIKREAEKNEITVHPGEKFELERVHNVHVGSSDKYFKIYYMTKYQHIGCNYIDLSPNYWDISIER